jgi:hypothetical protein
MGYSIPRISQSFQCILHSHWFIDVAQWNAPSIGFYEKTLGAKALVEWDTMRLEGDEEIGRLEKFLQ